MRDEITLSGPGYAVFHGRDARCFEIDGGIKDYKIHLMTEETRNNDHLHDRNITYVFPVYQRHTINESLSWNPLVPRSS